MRFCLWLLKKEFFRSRRIVYDKLVAYAAQRIDFYMLNIDIVSEIYPAMNIRELISDKDSLKLEFCKQVFEKCEQVRVLQVNVDKVYTSRDQVEDIMALISHSLLSKLSLLSISEDSLPRSLPGVNSNALTISIDLDSDYYLEISKILLTNSDVLKRAPQVCAQINGYNAVDLKILVQKAHK